MSRANSSDMWKVPAGAQWIYDGLYYKIGSHKFLFMWLGTEWIRSSAEKRMVCTKKNDLSEINKNKKGAKQ